MFRPPLAHEVRVFKSLFAKKYGSTISGWRREFSSCRLLDYKKFRRVCQIMNYGDRATEFWQGLDPHLGGAICLFDFDPDAVCSLIHLRQRLIALADTGPSSDKGPQLDPDAIFSRLSVLIRPVTLGRLQPQEWRKCLMSIGSSAEEGDKTFKYLDLLNTPPKTVGVPDIAWLLNLSALVISRQFSCTRQRLRQMLRH
jgi:hypothetical protein